jgi:hypothetical protein
MHWSGHRIPFYMDQLTPQMGFIDIILDPSPGFHSPDPAGLNTEHESHSARAYAVTRYESSAQ